MSIDLTNLSPAPFFYEGGEIFAGGNRYVSWLPHDSPHGHEYSQERRDADGAFFALARNAFDGDLEALAWWEANRRRAEATPAAGEGGVGT